MGMKKNIQIAVGILLLSILAVLPAASFADNAAEMQDTRTYTLRGRVIDGKTELPLPGAYIGLLNMEKQTVADEKGNFLIRDIPWRDSAIEISFIGYKTLNKTFTPRSNLNLGDIKMEENALALEEVVVQGTPPLAIQLGDTTQFNAGAYKTNPDATAEDLLKKMPGFTVQDGKVETQGETVSRVYVDGKRFFDNDPMAALRTLPADVVESIQLFDEQSQESRFTGFDDGTRNKTLNIVTTRKTKTSTFGRLSFGYGSDDRYLASANTSIFSNNHRWTVSAGSNNLNQIGFSMSELTGSGGGRGGGMGGGISGIQKTNVVGLNYSGQVGKARKTDLSANYFFYSTNNEVDRQTTQNFFATSDFDSRTYRSNSVTNSRSNTHRINMRAESNVNDKNMIVFEPRATLQFNNNLSNSMSINTLNGIMTDSAHTDNRTKLHAYDFSGDLMWMHRFAKAGRTTTVSAQFSLSDRNTDQYLQSLTRFFEETAFRDTLQDQFTNSANNSNRARLRLAYTEPLSENTRLIFNYTTSYNWSNSNRNTFLRNDITGEYEDIDLALSNRFKRDYVVNGGGAGYVYRKDRITLNLGMDYEYSQIVSKQLFPRNEKFDYGFHSVVPSLRFTYSVEKTKNLFLIYRGNSNLPSVTQLQNVIDNSNQLQVTMGNPDLKQSYQHDLRLRYSATNLQKSTTTNLMLSVNTQSNFITTERTFLTRDTTILGVEILSGAQISKPVNLNGYWTARADMGYSFSIKPLRINLNSNLGYSYSRIPSKFNGELSFTNSHEGRFRFSVSSNISEKIDFNISSSTGYTHARSSRQTNKFLNERIGVSVNWIFWKDFVLGTDYNMNFYYYPSSTTATQRYNMLNASLGKKFLKKKQAELKVAVYDLLNQNKSISHNVYANYVEDTFTNVLRRYFLLTFNYKFNTMGSRNQQQQQSGNRERMEFRREYGPPGGGPPPGGGGPPGRMIIHE